MEEYQFGFAAGSPATEAPMSCNRAAAGTVVRTYFVEAYPREGQPGHSFGTNEEDGPIYWSDVRIPVTLEGAPPNANPIAQ